jgi:acyl-CoA dehydrogenase
VIAVPGQAEASESATRATPPRASVAYDGTSTSWEASVARVALIAAQHADAVDADARFPIEAVEAMRAEGLLGAWVPIAFGGHGATVEQIMGACETLGAHCASAAMVFAMHQIQIACLVRHAGASAHLVTRLRAIAAAQRLLASGTSEIGVGGDLRTSRCGVRLEEGRFRLTKHAPVISYGLEADEFLVTARRTEEALPGDQVLILLGRDQCALEQTSTWSSLGFRGTCSHGFTIEARFDEHDVLPAPFATIASESMVPVSHLVWSSVWLGIATDAVRRARRFARDDARRQPGAAGNARLAELVAKLHAMRAVVHEAMREYLARMEDRDALSSMAHAIRVNNLKISSSEALVEIVQLAMRATGIAGYRLDTPVSLGRAMRDAFGAVVMISNDRILAANATMLMASRED